MWVAFAAVIILPVSALPTRHVLAASSHAGTSTWVETAVVYGSTQWQFSRDGSTGVTNVSDAQTGELPELEVYHFDSGGWIQDPPFTLTLPCNGFNDLTWALDGDGSTLLFADVCGVKTSTNPVSYTTELIFGTTDIASGNPGTPSIIATTSYAGNPPNPLQLAFDSSGHTAVIVVPTPSGDGANADVYSAGPGGWTLAASLPIGSQWLPLLAMSGYGSTILTEARTGSGTTIQAWRNGSGGWTGPSPLPLPPSIRGLAGSLALNQDGTVAIGGWPEFYSGVQPGVANVWRFDGASWGQPVELTFGRSTDHYGFGQTVTLSADGNKALVAAPLRKVKTKVSGAGELFSYANGRWSGPTELLAQKIRQAGGLGRLVSLSNDNANAFLETMYSASPPVVELSLIHNPLLIAVNLQGQYGALPALSGLSPKNKHISYSIRSQAKNVTGTLQCVTFAQQNSDVGLYPISDCKGFQDRSYTIVLRPWLTSQGSSYKVVPAPVTFTYAGPLSVTRGKPAKLSFKLTWNRNGKPVTNQWSRVLIDGRGTWCEMQPTGNDGIVGCTLKRFPKVGSPATLSATLEDRQNDYKLKVRSVKIPVMK